VRRPPGRQASAAARRNLRATRNRFGPCAVVLRTPTEENAMSLLWIILIIVLVLALLGFFGRGRF
jgi:hypothetical protein